MRVFLKQEDCPFQQGVQSTRPTSKASDPIDFSIWVNLGRFWVSALELQNKWENQQGVGSKVIGKWTDGLNHQQSPSYL